MNGGLLLMVNVWRNVSIFCFHLRIPTSPDKKSSRRYVSSINSRPMRTIPQIGDKNAKIDDLFIAPTTCKTQAKLSQFWNCKYFLWAYEHKSYLIFVSTPTLPSFFRHSDLSESTTSSNKSKRRNLCQTWSGSPVWLCIRKVRFPQVKIILWNL